MKSSSCLRWRTRFMSFVCCQAHQQRSVVTRRCHALAILPPDCTVKAADVCRIRESQHLSTNVNFSQQRFGFFVVRELYTTCCTPRLHGILGIQVVALQQQVQVRPPATACYDLQPFGQVLLTCLGRSLGHAMVQAAATKRGHFAAL